MEIKLLTLFLLTAVSCSTNEKESGLITINAVKALENREDHIVVRNRGHEPPILLLFDRKTGKYMNEIGKMGRGPAEYYSIPLDFYNPDEKIVYAMGNNDNVMIFNLKGDYLENFKIPDCFEIEGIPGFSSGSFDPYLDSATYVAYVENISGMEKKKMVLYSKDTLLKIYPNFLSWKRTPSRVFNVLPLETTFFHFGNKLFFKEAYNDTLFEVRKDNLVPRFVFSFGKYSIPYELQDEFLSSGKWMNSMFVDHFTENQDYLFFSLNVDRKTIIAICDKRTGKTKICKGIDSDASALIDDINGFLPIIQLHFSYNNEFVTSYEALQIKKWLDYNPRRAKLLAEKLPWLRNITEESNPVIMIGKCKD